MEKIKNLRVLYLFTISLFISGLVYGQDENNVWVVGIGINAVDFYPTNAPGNGNHGGFLNEFFNAEDHWNISAPQIMVTRHLVKNLSVDGLISFNSIKKYGDVAIEKTSYIGMDVNFRYSFMDTSKAFTIFALAGGGYTSFNPETLWIEGEEIKFGSGLTLNVGGGINYWFNDTMGLNLEGLYKQNWSKVRPHLFYSLSLVFKLNSSSNFTWRDGK